VQKQLIRRVFFAMKILRLEEKKIKKISAISASAAFLRETGVTQSTLLQV